ncbi:MAG: YybH family protein [Planctomycetota bacterium]
MNMKLIVTSLLPGTVALMLATGQDRSAIAQKPVAAQEAALSPLEETVVRESEATVKAFNAGDAAALGAMFLETGELVDEAGTVHAGEAAITDLFKGFFAKFPKATLEMLVDSARPVGETLAVEEGLRRITTADGEAAQVRYVALRSKQGDHWRIASYREFTDDPLPTPREALQGAAWIVGDWVDESPEGRTEITFRWSDDGNFLLGDYTMSAAGAGESKSTQRIGWDPVNGQVRSWTFDDDGGFTEGRWMRTDEGWVVFSEATMPDGTTGSATLLIGVKDADHLVVRGTDRFIGDVEQPDFEMTIARKPPQPGAVK